jgi:hypothetical protein
MIFEFRPILNQTWPDLSLSVYLAHVSSFQHLLSIVIFKEAENSLETLKLECIQGECKSGIYSLEFQNRWVSGLRPSYGIINTIKHNISETGSNSFIRWEAGNTYRVGSLFPPVSETLRYQVRGGKHLLCWVPVPPPSLRNVSSSGERRETPTLLGPCSPLVSGTLRHQVRGGETPTLLGPCSPLVSGTLRHQVRGGKHLLYWVPVHPVSETLRHQVRGGKHLLCSVPVPPPQFPKRCISSI